MNIMASLWSRIAKKQNIALYPPFTNEHGKMLFTAINDLPPALVNIQAIHDCIGDKGIDLDVRAQDCIPCRKTLWLECIFRSGQRTAVLIIRFDHEQIPLAFAEVLPPQPSARFLIHSTQIVEYQDTAIIAAEHLTYLDGDGRILVGGRLSIEQWQDTAQWTYLLACESLTTMNTRGTRVDPPLDKPPVQVVNPKRAPCSVWHTIHLPHFAHERLNAPTSDEMIERREHWVRAHRRDYRDGGGLFGRVKALVWVPEFKRGNAELGTVKQSYSIFKAGQ